MFDKILADFSFYLQAQDESLWHEVLAERILSYKFWYLKIMEKNINKIKVFLDRIGQKNNIKINGTSNNILKLLIFLESGKSLLNNKNEINKNEFKKYERLYNEETRKEWIQTLNYVENNLGWIDIKKLNSILQFIITFYYDLELRIKYFEKYYEVRQTKKKTRLLEESYNKLKKNENFDYRFMLY